MEKSRWFGKPVPIALADLQALLIFCLGESFAWLWHFSGDVPFWVVTMAHLVAATGVATYGIRATQRIICALLESAAEVLRSFRMFRQELRRTFPGQRDRDDPNSRKPGD